MARCNCSNTCSCKIIEGDGITVAGSGRASDPYVISAEETGGGVSGWSPGDRKETYRAAVEAGWLECNGQAVSRATYADLFTAVGTRFGPGNGSTTFNVPDERGRVSVGAGGAYVQDALGGSATGALAVENLPPHAHSMTHTHSINHNHDPFESDTDGAHQHRLEVSDDPGNSLSTVPRGEASGTETESPVKNSGGHHHTIDVPNFTGTSGGSSASSTGATGSGAAFSLMQPYRVVKVLIKT